jgi:1-acyl-sn-glycerol-3-phosphate acyltransferase
VIQLPPELPRAANPLRRAFGRLLLRIIGWKVAGEMPNVRRLVIIVAPHTSNWDFVIGFAARAALGLRASWLGKHTLFRPPFGWFFRWVGGIPVVRSESRDLVSQTVAAFDSRERLALALAPEGTRSEGAEWRSGFWYIARGAGVPILPVALDWESRTLRLGPAMDPGEDPEAGIASIRNHFAGLRGRRPNG